MAKTAMMSATVLQACSYGTTRQEVVKSYSSVSRVIACENSAFDWLASCRVYRFRPAKDVAVAKTVRRRHCACGCR